MKVIVREAAEEDLHHIFAWISEHNPLAATKMVAEFATESTFSNWTALPTWGVQDLIRVPES